MTGCRSGWRSSFWLIPLIDTNEPSRFLITDVENRIAKDLERRRTAGAARRARRRHRGAVLQRGRLLPGRHRGRGDRRARRAAAADHARAAPVGGMERRAVGRRRRARAVRGLDPRVVALVRRARPRAARVRPHAALPRGVRRLRAVRRARRGPRRRPALDRRGGLRRLHRRAGDPARPRDVPDRPAAQPHAARVPAHLLEQPRRARRRRPGARPPRHVVDPPAGGRARARGGRASRPSPSASTSRSRAAAASRRCSASRSTSCSATRAGSCRRSSRWSRRPPSRSSARSTPICSPGRASSSPWPPRSAATC